MRLWNYRMAYNVDRGSDIFCIFVSFNDFLYQVLKSLHADLDDEQSVFGDFICLGSECKSSRAGCLSAP